MIGKTSNCANCVLFEKKIKKKIPKNYGQGRVFRPGPETRVPVRLPGMKIFRVLKFFVWVPGLVLGLILKFSAREHPWLQVR